MRLFHTWAEIKEARRENSRKWAKRHGVDEAPPMARIPVSLSRRPAMAMEARLYEMSKLRSQFRGIIAGILKFGAREEGTSSDEDDDDPDAHGEAPKHASTPRLNLEP